MKICTRCKTKVSENQQILTIDNFIAVASDIGSVMVVGSDRSVIVVCSETVVFLGNTL